MEPLAALGLASAVIQFIDFGSKLLKETGEIAESGSTISVHYLKTVTGDLESFNKTLGQQVLDQLNGSNSEEEEALCELISKCSSLARELLDGLANVSSQAGKGAKWANIRAALKTIWKKDRIETLARRLNEYRDQLILRVLMLFNAQQRTQNRNLDTVQTYEREIMEIVSINRTSLTQESLKAEQRHAETIAAILTTRGGGSRTITGPRYQKDFSKILKPSKLAPTITTFSSESDIPETLVSRSGPAELIEITTKILNALHFRTIRDRRSAVSKAHENTFQWIFRDPQANERPWSNFSRWLRIGSGCYWINGKAGSGKSTLMKYLQDGTESMQKLSIWAGSKQLIVPSFFFWYAGTSLQRSQIGPLRSLLFDVLSQRQELVLVLFPDVCRAIISQQLKGPVELSPIELLKAFRTLASSVPQDVKICFVVDGIDEYEGDSADLGVLFSEAITSASIKILLSSRPTPACVRAFSDFPKLRLQDLTRKDISRYAREMLAKDPVMQKLEAAEQGATRCLVTGIAEKANGVFLWVILVVRSLLRGLHDYDTLDDLQEKLDELPSDIEKLYDHMLGNMSSKRHRQGSQLLQIALKSLETHGEYPMTVLQLSRADDENYKRCFETGIEFMSKEQEEWQCEAMEGRLRSRCCGLLEVQELWTPHDGRNTIGFLHRTVVDFLRIDTIWARLTTTTNDTKFDVTDALLCSSKLEMKALGSQRHGSGRDSAAYNSMLRLLTYGHQMDIQNNAVYQPYLSEMTRTMGLYWHDSALFRTPEIQLQSVSDATRRISSRLHLTYPDSFLMAAASHCPNDQFEGLLTYFYPLNNRDSSTENKRSCLAAYLFIHWVDERLIPVRRSILRNVNVLCDSPNRPADIPSSLRKLWNDRWKSAVPSSMKSGWSLWEFILHYCYSLVRETNEDLMHLSDPVYVREFSDMLIALITAGASATCSIAIISKSSIRNKKPSCITCTALQVMHHLLMHIWNLLHEPYCRANTLSSGRISAKTLDSIAEKFCWLELTMCMKGAAMGIDEQLDLDGTSQHRSGRIKMSSSRVEITHDRYPSRPVSQHVGGMQATHHQYPSQDLGQKSVIPGTTRTLQWRFQDLSRRVTTTLPDLEVKQRLPLRAGFLRNAIDPETRDIDDGLSARLRDSPDRPRLIATENLDHWNPSSQNSRMNLSVLSDSDSDVREALAAAAGKINFSDKDGEYRLVKRKPLQQPLPSLSDIKAIRSGSAKGSNQAKGHDPLIATMVSTPWYQRVQEAQQKT